ncbi:restriction endonuclease subunit S [Exiguobacterium artemiae]|uniref:restriction endonuclease subunit S n=1 Tax=Exiguobacterium artemiae TaxID=340145 RepID=UPI0029654ACA|nr:restriction endonuclease subunit S [Exiguobacterium sibiricum]MDW2886432.1 restriction endonuclease subunit S [Exiguobacterium sibiricum]
MKYNSILFTIDEVCSITDCQHKTAPTLDYPSEYRMLRTVNIRNGQLRNIDSTKSVSKEIYDQWSVRGYLESGDVILTREAPMGEVALLRENEKYKFFLGQRILQLKAFPDIISPEFLYYSLQTKELRHQIMMNEGTGSVVSNIRIPLLKKIKILVPPLSQQKNITKILIDIDDKILLNKKIISKLERIAQTLFKRWFIDFEFPNEEGQPYKTSGGEMVESELGKIPKGWKVEFLHEYVDFLSGGTPKTTIQEYWNGSIPFFTPKDAKSNLYTTVTEKTITELGLEKCNSKLYPKNTLFITARGTVGKLALANKAMAMNQSCFALKHKENKQFYLYHVVENLVKKIILGANGAVFSAINLNDLKNLNYAYSNESLISKFENTVSNFYDQMSLLEKENIKLQQIRDSFLPKLLSGEIKISDELEV